MFRSRTTTATSLAKAARDLERQMMTMEVVSGDEPADPADSSASSSQSPRNVPLPDGLAFGPYGVTPLLGLHYDAKDDTATS